MAGVCSCSGDPRERDGRSRDRRAAHRRACHARDRASGSCPTSTRTARPPHAPERRRGRSQPELPVPLEPMAGGPFDYPGPRPLSEPETRFARRLIPRCAPPSRSGSTRPCASWTGRVARAVVEDAQPPRGPASAAAGALPGSGADLAEPPVPGTTSFVVELQPGRLSAACSQALHARGRDAGAGDRARLDPPLPGIPLTRPALARVSGAARSERRPVSCSLNVRRSGVRGNRARTGRRSRRSAPP